MTTVGIKKSRFEDALKHVTSLEFDANEKRNEWIAGYEKAYVYSSHFIEKTVLYLKIPIIMGMLF